jgi:hypothetical protein
MQSHGFDTMKNVFFSTFLEKRVDNIENDFLVLLILLLLFHYLFVVGAVGMGVTAKLFKMAFTRFSWKIVKTIVPVVPRPKVIY